MPQCSTASCQGPKLYAHDSEENSKAKRISPTNRTWCTPRCQQTVAKRLGLYLRVRFLVFELTRPPSSSCLLCVGISFSVMTTNHLSNIKALTSTRNLQHAYSLG
ncbi:hypothetical protein DFH06DRAFT_1346756 [Mycena polygramma]|nr:hypothetical protein DFH06DRAFT_1346756 [Mycena polygramma]